MKNKKKIHLSKEKTTQKETLQLKFHQGDKHLDGNPSKIHGDSLKTNM